MSVSTAIYNLRKSRNLTQSQLQIGLRNQVVQTKLSQYETGARTPSLENLEVLANFYHVPMSFFFIEEESSNSELAATLTEMMDKDETYRILFQEAMKLSPKDLRPIIDLMRNISASKEAEINE